MLRPALTAGLMILALAVPAAADGPSEFDRPAGYGRAPVGGGPARIRHHVRPHRYQVGAYAGPRADAQVQAHVQARVQAHAYAHAGPRRGSPVRPVSYGERDGPVFHAWLPRNTNLPIYNIPPPFFPEE